MQPNNNNNNYNKQLRDFDFFNYNISIDPKYKGNDILDFKPGSFHSKKKINISNNNIRSLR